ncbi:Yap3p SKDI_08G0330 [Saccharomyces kudriavzevii IFO 1802]|uniref:YAP3-like protein n=2 Tax=Saccharomyces kudriavzevii (strain ATCC MYA-4449 / AS 2.2408 / CBS 8840 / NBRC 1802 / NCYC 2889) TaxID=226230 RepID=J5S664_SACK1|nr:uncharacterized protein SKDI_08G0330 [Saccharomyces kudriavzevii IFO 1802]EJT43941.1 YAP3-like protein [Saccharomyces kudriavzevii IFO 1802]CAI4063427.1 hypothetical protein SKDI_08G0330 [Saccharomyces kudriavzevii IFO 1802]
MNLSSPDVNKKTNGLIKCVNSQRQEQDIYNEISIFQNDNECMEQQRNQPNDDTLPFPILDDDCPAIDLTEASSDMIFQGETSFLKTDAFQNVQLTPNSGDCSSNVDVNNNDDNNDDSNVNDSFEKMNNPSSSVALSLFDEENIPGDFKAKKKAQNRAAQRAFRERKEARLRELQDKLMKSEKNRQSLLKEIKELRKVNTEINAENRLLLRSGNEKCSNDLTNDTDHKYSFPTKDEFFTSMVLEGKLKNKNIHSSNENEVTPKRNAQYTEEAGRQVLTIPATWEYLHKLSEDRDFDVTYVMNKLQGQECCHTHGPAYKRTLIDLLVKEATLNE